MIIRIFDAIASLYPNAEYVVRGDTLEWFDKETPEPTQEELDLEIVRLQAEYDAQEYARNRQAEYPSLDDLIVALWESVVEERTDAVTELEIKRQSVKDKYPK